MDLGCENSGKMGKVEVDLRCRNRRKNGEGGVRCGNTWKMGREEVDLRCGIRERTNSSKPMRAQAHFVQTDGAGKESNPRPSLRGQERTNSA